MKEKFKIYLQALVLKANAFLFCSQHNFFTHLQWRRTLVQKIFIHLLPKRILHTSFTNNFYYLNLMNKYKYWGIIAAIAVFLTIVGYWAKITHQSYADKALTVGMWLLAVSAPVYIYFKFVALKNKKE